MAKTISGHTAITSSSSPLLRKCWVPGRPIWIRVHRAYAPLFLRLMVLLDQVEPLTQRNTWSFNYREPRMGSGVSDHAGYAIDCWSDGIGMHTWPSRMSVKQAREIAGILERFKTADGRHIFGWGIAKPAPGGNLYTGPTYNRTESNDPMHFYIAKGISVWDALRTAFRMAIKGDGRIR
jgi:hypothetical protein